MDKPGECAAVDSLRDGPVLRYAVSHPIIALGIYFTAHLPGVVNSVRFIRPYARLRPGAYLGELKVRLMQAFQMVDAVLAASRRLAGAGLSFSASNKNHAHVRHVRLQIGFKSRPLSPVVYVNNTHLMPLSAGIVQTCQVLSSAPRRSFFENRQSNGLQTHCTAHAKYHKGRYARPKGHI